MAEVTPERIMELRAICQKLDPDRRRAWRLEVYNLVDGRQRLAQQIDLKVGRPVKNYKRKADNG